MVQSLEEFLAKKSILSFEGLWKELGQYIEQEIPSEYIIYLEKEDLLDEVRVVYGSESVDLLVEDQYFHQVKRFVFENIDEEPKVFESWPETQVAAELNGALLFPIYFSEGMRGTWVLINPKDQEAFTTETLDFLDSLFTSCYKLLEELKLRRIVRIYKTEQKLISKLNKLVDSNYYLNQFLKYLIAIIEGAVDAQIVVFMMYDEVSGQYNLQVGNADGCEFYADQEELFKNLASQTLMKSIVAKTYSGKYFQGEKYGLDRLETSLALPLKFYGKTLGAIVLLNKKNQENFNELDVKLMNIIIRSSKAVMFREREKNSIVNMFKRFVSDRIVREILENPTRGMLQEDRKEITVLFIDLNGFTELTEYYSPSEVLVQLNDFLSEMTDLVFAYGGTLDKYIGDEIMALFGAPLSLENHAELAVECALAMQAKMQELRASWAEHDRPDLTASIGIFTGMSVIGAIGCEKYMDYTAIGKTVNMASRLTDACQTNSILIGSKTYELMQDVVHCEQIDDLQLKGIDKSTMAFRIKGLKSDQDLRSQIVNSKVEERIRIIRCLGSFRCYSESELSREFLGDSNKLVRSEAIQTLEKLNRESDIDSLIDRLDLETDKELRKRLLAVISGISGEAVVSLLDDYLSEVDGDLRSRVIDVIGHDGTDENKKLLLPLLTDANHEVRANVAHALYRHGDQSVIEILINMLKSNESEMKISAIDVLGKIGTTQVIQPLVETLEKSKDIELLFATARAFGRIFKPRTVKFLKHLLMESPLYTEWEPLILAKEDNEHSISYYKKSLNSMNTYVVYAALISTPKIKSLDFGQEYLDIVKSYDSRLQIEAIHCLKKYPNGLVVPVLIDILNDAEHSIKLEVLREFGMRNQGRLLPIMHQYLESPEIDLVMTTIISVGMIAKPSSLDFLLRIYQETENANLKATIIRSLGSFDSKDVIPVLLDGLHSTIGRIRANSVDSLMQRKYHQALPLVLPLLNDENNRVRANAAVALHRFGDTNIFKHLDQMMRSSDKWMKLSAIWALTVIGGDKAQELISVHVSDKDYDVKLRAILSLYRMEHSVSAIIEKMMEGSDDNNLMADYLG
ncbi:MAG: HEAT repeat domain-containing protein [Candidatus Cloacimonetes bacterium]|nr:HEAT repeat domain-containing protein [Candidatus Cloacimonadota bacterium]